MRVLKTAHIYTPAWESVAGSRRTLYRILQRAFRYQVPIGAGPRSVWTLGHEPVYIQTAR